MLRQDWGFDGFLVSDANAVHNLLTHGFAADLTDAAVRALSAGLDLEMATNDPAYGHLPDAVEAGLIDEAALDTSVRRLLTAKVRMGLFENPYVDEQRAAEVLADPAHREVARTAAQRSAVLLRNEGDLLPLAVEGSIAVIGPLADSRRDTIGPWVFDYDAGRDHHRAAGHPGPRRRRGDGDLRARHPAGAADVPVDVRHVGRQRPGDPANFDDAAELERAVQAAAQADVAVWCSASGRT